MVASVVARRLSACQRPRQPHVRRVRAASSSMMRFGGARSALAAVAVVLLLGLGACGGSSNKGTATIDASSDAAGGCTAGGTAAGMIGEACGCDRDCQSGFCVDGVCCNSDCTGTCRACNVQGSPGICALVPGGRHAAHAGRVPRSRCRPPAVSTAPATATAAAASTSRGRSARRAACSNAAGGRRQRLRRAGPLQGGAGDDLRAVQLRSGHARLRRHVPRPTPTASAVSSA